MQSLPGFRDFLPDDCAKRNYIFARWREVARRYGFVEWEGPPLEPTELYKKKSGDEIVEQLFNFADKGERDFSAMKNNSAGVCANIFSSIATSSASLLLQLIQRYSHC